MIELGDKYYIFDIKKICDFINYSDKTESKEREILDNYEDGTLISKNIRELTMPGNTQIDSIKYDMLKMFILQVINYEKGTFDFGSSIVFNTLVYEGFLKEINI